MYFVTLLTLLLLFAMLALSLNLITGLAGQVSLGHAAFFGIGAYTVGALMMHGVDFWMALVAAGVSAGLAGLLLGAISLRLRDDYLAIATIALNFLVVALLLYLPYFGGAFGISDIKGPFGTVGTAWMMLIGFLLVVLVHERIRHSDLGLALLALKESEDAAAALGVDVRRFKMTVFAMGTAIAGVTGGGYAIYIGVLHPGDFGFPLSVTVLAMVAIGGMGTLWGPVLGALVLGGFAQAFTFVQNYQLVLYGLLLALVMRYRPQGVLGRS